MPSRLVFLGSNPSCRAKGRMPLVGGGSSARNLDSWLAAIGIGRADILCLNVSNEPTPNDRPLKASEMRAEIRRLKYLLAGRLVVALGCGPSYAAGILIGLHINRDPEVERIDPPIQVFPFHHPSGRNRKLNDPIAFGKDLQKLKEWIWAREAIWRVK